MDGPQLRSVWFFLFSLCLISRRSLLPMPRPGPDPWPHCDSSHSPVGQSAPCPAPRPETTRLTRLTVARHVATQLGGASFTGSAPGERMKKKGVLLVESSQALKNSELSLSTALLLEAPRTLSGGPGHESGQLQRQRSVKAMPCRRRARHRSRCSLCRWEGSACVLGREGGQSVIGAELGELGVARCKGCMDCRGSLVRSLTHLARAIDIRSGRRHRITSLGRRVLGPEEEKNEIKREGKAPFSLLFSSLSALFLSSRQLPQLS